MAMCLEKLGMIYQLRKLVYNRCRMPDIDQYLINTCSMPEPCAWYQTSDMKACELGS